MLSQKTIEIVKSTVPVLKTQGTDYYYILL